jgi:hypothetical protein
LKAHFYATGWRDTKMNRRVIVLISCAAFLLFGVVAVTVFGHSRTDAMPIRAAVSPDEATAEARADAVARELHRKDHDRYQPQAPKAIGELPKAPDKTP